MASSQVPSTSSADLAARAARLRNAGVERRARSEGAHAHARSTSEWHGAAAALTPQLGAGAVRAYPAAAAAAGAWRPLGSGAPPTAGRYRAAATSPGSSRSAGSPRGSSGGASPTSSSARTAPAGPLAARAADLSTSMSFASSPRRAEVYGTQTPAERRAAATRAAAESLRRSGSDSGAVSPWRSVADTRASGDQLMEGIPPYSPRLARQRHGTAPDDDDATMAGVVRPSRVRMSPDEFVAYLATGERPPSPTRRGRTGGGARPRGSSSAAHTPVSNPDLEISEDEVVSMWREMRLTELQQLAFDAAIPHEMIEEATYEADPKEAVIQLLVRHGMASMVPPLSPSEQQELEEYLDAQSDGSRRLATEEESWDAEREASEELDLEEALLYQELAAVAVQRRARGASARRAYAAQLEARNTGAACAIQARYRGSRARRDLREEEAAAITLQRRARGMTARRAYSAESNERRAAARAIQARYRGGRTRRELQEEREYQRELAAGAVEVQRVWRGRQGRQRAEQAHPLYGLPPWAGDAATVVQSRWRGGRAREDVGHAMAKHKRKRHNAASLVQGRFRSSVAARDAAAELLLRRVRKFKRQVDIGELISLFDKHDADGNATLSWEEFHAAISEAQQAELAYAEVGEDDLISDVTLRAVFAAADTDADGSLDLVEFLGFLGMSPGAISVWLDQGPSAGVGWLAGLDPPGWMTESWIREGEDLTARRRKREQEARHDALRELRWPPSPHKRARDREQRQQLLLGGGGGGGGGGGSPPTAAAVPGSPKARALELAQRRGAKPSSSPGKGDRRRSPRGSAGGAASELRGAELRARAETMLTSPRASRAQLLARARAHQQADEPRTPRYLD
jgi:hypothetical protein